VWQPSSPIIPGQERRGAGMSGLDEFATAVPGSAAASPSSAPARATGQTLQSSPTADGITPQTRAVDQLSMGVNQAPVVVNNFMNNAPTINNQGGGSQAGELNVAAAASGYRTPADIGSYSRASYTSA